MRSGFLLDKMVSKNRKPKKQEMEPKAPTFDLVEYYNPTMVSWRRNGPPVSVECKTTRGRSCLIMTYLDILQESERNQIHVKGLHAYSGTVPRDHFNPLYLHFGDYFRIDEEAYELTVWPPGFGVERPLILDPEFCWAFPVVKASNRTSVTHPEVQIPRILPRENQQYYEPAWEDIDMEKYSHVDHWGIPDDEDDDDCYDPTWSWSDENDPDRYGDDASWS